MTNTISLVKSIIACQEDLNEELCSKNMFDILKQFYLNFIIS